MHSRYIPSVVYAALALGVMLNGLAHLLIGYDAIELVVMGNTIGVGVLFLLRALRVD